MNKLEEIRLINLEKLENHLRQLGCEKCNYCQRFMDKKYIINGRCEEC